MAGEYGIIEWKYYLIDDFFFRSHNESLQKLHLFYEVNCNYEKWAWAFKCIKFLAKMVSCEHWTLCLIAFSIYDESHNFNKETRARMHTSIAYLMPQHKSTDCTVKSATCSSLICYVNNLGNFNWEFR